MSKTNDGAGKAGLLNGFLLNESTGYFQNQGVDVMAFDDFYPEGHQSGVSILMHGQRVATNGELRFEQTPGQWQPIPKRDKREVDASANTVTTWLSFPDESKHLSGFNPMIYPDFRLSYKITAKGRGPDIVVTADLDQPIPERFQGKVCFNMELFPGTLFGKPWIMDKKQGIFPEQPNGPTISLTPNYLYNGDYSTEESRNSEVKTDIKHLSGDNKGYNPIIADDIIAAPYAVGKRFTVRPDDPYSRFTIESKSVGTELKLYDGRMNHNNGWFVVSSEIPAGATANAIEWVITPSVIDGWTYGPIVQTSQVGYHSGQPKVAIIELDKRVTGREKPSLFKVTETGDEEVFTADGQEWGQFLRYNYVKFDFTGVKDEGLYKVRYGQAESSIFRIADDVYDRGVWQPVLEYFLPVQMCHMRVNEKYRVWHDLCHMDDAQMAPLNFNHIDGYAQGSSTLTKYKSGDVVPGLNIGGWHDAGDDDLRLGSQAGEIYILAMAYEAFGVDYDETAIDQETRIVEIHQPDGKNDILQQIEHGALSVVGAYEALGRPYRGIINRTLRQYVLLGDTSAMTDNVMGNEDDRWVFTEENPPAELTAAAQLACVYRALKGFNDELAGKSLAAARELFAVTDITRDTRLYKVADMTDRAKAAKLHAATELLLATGEDQYKDYILSQVDFIPGAIENVGWFIGRADKAIGDAGLSAAIRGALPALKESLAKQSAETPFGIPYRPYIWGAGWIIQRLGFQYYYLHKAYPDVFGPDLVYDALNFILGCHPGTDRMSFASGVGANNVTVAYGLNRADWSFIPGGVVSGTALIRPDYPELLVFPYLWQQVEYVLGGGSSNYMFLVLAAQQMLGAGADAAR
ncbi:MAG: glycoside hydrolase family 9 protein [Oscillospiraceae bacterium]|nr:glycoside hydrolase family 9 protein [Oscillospiraceae bacterium]